MKVFVYDLPSKYNNAWLSNERCKNHLFASEVAIHKALLTTSIRTLDPTQADFFFVPVYVSCNFSTINGFPAIGHARSLLSSAVHLISTEYPFWNRSRGSDHVFVASHDYGACFHAMVSHIYYKICLWFHSIINCLWDYSDHKLNYAIPKLSSTLHVFPNILFLVWGTRKMWLWVMEFQSSWGIQ